jgi:hypothetical protein
VGAAVGLAVGSYVGEAVGYWGWQRVMSTEPYPQRCGVRGQERTSVGLAVGSAVG